MSDPKGDMPRELEAMLFAEVDRSTAALVAMVTRWPDWRKRLVQELLGAAVGACDTFGGDAEQVVSNIRRDCGKAAELLPPSELLAQREKAKN